MKRIYGYCRISRSTQNIERQERNILSEYPNAIIYKEAYTGTKIQGRKELDKLLKQVTPGDVIVFDSVSRMARNAESGYALYQELFDKGIDLVFLKEPNVNSSVFKEALERQISTNINTGDDSTNMLIEAVIEALNAFQKSIAEKQIHLEFARAQKEVDDLHQRTREGIETARRSGKQIGRVSGTEIVTAKEKNSIELIRKYSKAFDGYLNDGECMKLIGLSRNTYYKYKKKLMCEYIG